MGGFSVGHTPSCTGVTALSWVYDGQPAGEQFDPMGHSHTVNCPQADIVGVLNRLEGLTWVRYCRLCFGVGQKCRCSAVPHQAPGQALALWTPPTMSYAAMASSTETTASSSAAGPTPPSYPPPGMPPLEPMDTLPAPTSENLLATAGVGRGGRG